MPREVRHRRPAQAEAGGVDEQRAEYGAHHVCQQHDPYRLAGLLDPAHPTVAGEHEQDPRHPDKPDPKPLHGVCTDGRVAAREQVDERGGKQFAGQGQGGSDDQCKPRGRHPLGVCTVEVARTERPRRPARGAVLHKLTDHQQQPDHSDRDAQTTQLRGAQVTDDRRVNQEIRRLGGEHNESRCSEQHQPTRR